METLIKLFAPALILLIIVCFATWVIKYTEDKPEGESKKNKNLPDIKPTCKAFMACDMYEWDCCISGACKYHCGNFCKCAPIGKPGFKPTVIKGGKDSA